MIARKTMFDSQYKSLFATAALASLLAASMRRNLTWRQAMMTFSTSFLFTILFSRAVCRYFSIEAQDYVIAITAILALSGEFLMRGYLTYLENAGTGIIAQIFRHFGIIAQQVKQDQNKTETPESEIK